MYIHSFFLATLLCFLHRVPSSNIPRICSVTSLPYLVVFPLVRPQSTVSVHISVLCRGFNHSMLYRFDVCIYTVVVTCTLNCHDLGGTVPIFTALSRPSPCLSRFLGSTCAVVKRNVLQQSNESWTTGLWYSLALRILLLRA